MCPDNLSFSLTNIFSRQEKISTMKEKKKKVDPKSDDPSVIDESIEELIETRKSRAEAYRKILNALESKLKKDN